jgi:hypothetical protein
MPFAAEVSASATPHWCAADITGQINHHWLRMDDLAFVLQLSSASTISPRWIQCGAVTQIQLNKLRKATGNSLRSPVRSADQVHFIDRQLRVKPDCVTPAIVKVIRENEQLARAACRHECFAVDCSNDAIQWPEAESLAVLIAFVL